MKRKYKPVKAKSPRGSKPIRINLVDGSIAGTTKEIRRGKANLRRYIEESK